jgi:hypothetical protein
MLRRLSTLFALISLVTLSLAQMTVVSTSPANGAVSVLLATTLSVTFSQPLDTTMRYPDGYCVGITEMLGDSGTINSVSYSADLRTFYMNVTLRPNTDYCPIILIAHSSTGQNLARPYTINFTTSTSSGTRSISGHVSLTGGNPSRTVVGVTQARPFGDNMRVVRGAAYDSASGLYQITNVRTGHYYWIVAGLDVNGDGEINPTNGDAVGFYDADNDGQADSLVIGANDFTNINVALIQYSPITMMQRGVEAVTMAQAFDPDLSVVIGLSQDQRVSNNGTSMGWAFVLRSPRLHHAMLALASTMSLALDTNVAHAPDPDPLMSPIPRSIIDSDSAMHVAERNGGAAFRAAHPNCDVRMQCGDFYWFTPAQHYMLWEIDYFAQSGGSNPPAMVILVNLETGAFYSSMNSSEPTAAILPAKLSLDDAYPNPFNATTTIRFALPRSEKVTVGIFDAQGRQVGTLYQGMQSAGNHTLRWNGAQFSSGVYFVRVDAGASSATKKIVLMK